MILLGRHPVFGGMWRGRPRVGGRAGGGRDPGGRAAQVLEAPVLGVLLLAALPPAPPERRVLPPVVQVLYILYIIQQYVNGTQNNLHLFPCT